METERDLEWSLGRSKLMDWEDVCGPELLPALGALTGERAVSRIF